MVQLTPQQRHVLQRSILDGHPYEALQPQLQKAVSHSDWQEHVKAVYIHKGWPWRDLACSACHEADYYDQLLRTFRTKQRLFPYHLATAICGRFRVTPFRYYYDVVFQAMRNEMPYDKIPNFTAAEILRLLGIGRNEYIAKLNACNEKKLLWRVNKGIAKEHLPAEPVRCKLLGWWRVQPIALTDKEFRELSRDEEELLRTAERAPGGTPIAEHSLELVHSLYRRQLVYIEVPVSGDQRFSTSSLDGFVSNRDLVAGDSDPMEALLYEVFVSNSERLRLQELADVLEKGLTVIQQAMSIAVRMGFAVLMDGPGADAADVGDTEAFTGQLGSAGQELAVAILLDAEATSFLMMGSLSPGMKKHSVTLFEGGRLAGKHVIEDMREELWRSVKAGASFEGEMAHIVGVLEALATIVDTASHSEKGYAVEVIRKESLSMLAPSAAARVLQMAYAAVVAIEPLPGPPVPLSLAAPDGPALFGAGPAALSPWLTLAVLAEMGAGPVSLAFTCGQRVSSMPPQAHSCTHAFLWTWDRARWPAKDMGPQPVPHLIESKFLLYVLNGLLSCTAVLMQPLWLRGEIPKPQYPFQKGGVKETEPHPLPVTLVPLPLRLQRSKTHQGTTGCTGLRLQPQESFTVHVPKSLEPALRGLGLEDAIGYMWMIPASACCMPGSSASAKAANVYVPYDFSFGAPLYNPALCRMVCGRVQEASLLSARGIRQQRAHQQQFLQKLATFVSACSSSRSEQPGSLDPQVLERHDVILPAKRLLFDGSSLSQIEGWASRQQLVVGGATDDR